MNKNKFKQVFPIGMDEAKSILSSEDVEKKCDVMVSVAFFEENLEWAQDVFITLLDDPEIKISCLAATCLGHLARINGGLEKEKIVNALKGKMDNDEMKGYIEDALEDVNKFL